MIYLYMLAAFLVGSVGTTVFGFYEGYRICTDVNQAAALEAENKALKENQSYYEQATKAAQDAQAKAEANETKANQIVSDIKAKLIAASGKTSNCIYTQDFFKQLNSLP